MTYANVFGTKQTPQRERIPGREDQSRNNAGGFGWQADDWARLDRFLILGSESPTYYVDQRTLTIQNAEAVLRCIKADGSRVVARTVEVSQAGRAPKNEPALFVLALCAGLGDAATKAAAYEALSKVARIPTHLFRFLGYVQEHRGWGRGLRQAVAAWYNTRDEGQLAYQSVKYRQRDGWTHRDALRLAHPKSEGIYNAIYRWMVKGWDAVPDAPPENDAMKMIWAYERACHTDSEGDVINLITEYGLPWEALDTKWLGSANVWAALLPDLPMTAMIRNLARMTANGLIAPFSEAERIVVGKLADSDVIRKARVHPIQVLSAMLTYAQGHGMRGSLKWTPSRKVIDALDGAFYGSFGNVEPTGKRLVLALDVSGSMSTGEVAGVPGLTPRKAAAAMALVTATVEKDYHLMAFSHELVPLDISPRERLDDVEHKMSAIPMGGTDCALPMMWALGMQTDMGPNQGMSYSDYGKYKRVGQMVPDIEGFVIYTDNETWAGKVHPSQALTQYRREGNMPHAKLVTVAMTSGGFTIADPQDGGMLDVVGFDTATPQVVSGFIKDEK